jgi:hypothetical protein
MAVFHILAVIALLSLNSPVTEAGMVPQPNNQTAPPYVVISGTPNTHTHTPQHTHTQKKKACTLTGKLSP